MHPLLLMILFVTALAEVHEGLENKAVIAGERTQLTCAQDSADQVFWFHMYPKQKTVQILFDGRTIQLLPSFSNTNATGRVRGQTLDINPVRLENSGIFKCAVNGVEYSFHLIVLGSNPECGTALNASHPGFVDLWCRVNYTGFWPPRMQWMTGGRKLDSNVQRLSTSVSTTMTVEAESVGSNANYSCETFFAAEDNTLKDGQQTVNNVPNFAFTYTTNAVYDSATSSTPLTDEATLHNLPLSSNGIMWILTSCAALSCAIVFVVIVFTLRKHPAVCRKSAEPDLVQNAEGIENGANPVVLNRVDVHPHELRPDFEADEPIFNHNGVYAEVVILDRRPQLHMQDSPAWNNQHNNVCGRSIQNSPAWSHSSKNLPPSRSATPRNASPMANVENIEYLDINSVGTIPVPQSQPPPPRRPPARLPTFQAVSYASIDHTSRPPPPLPPQ